MGPQQNKGNQQQVYSDREQIKPISKVVFMFYGGVQTVCLLLLSWKVYDPSMWLPLPHWSTFFVGVILVAVFWFLWLNRIDTLDKK